MQRGDGEKGGVRGTDGNGIDQQTSQSGKKIPGSGGGGFFLSARSAISPFPVSTPPSFGSDIAKRGAKGEIVGK